MLRWREDYVENSSQKKRIAVGVNGESEIRSTMYLEPDWTFQEFLNAASKRLSLTFAASRAFNVDGTEADDCMMIEDNGMLFLSAGEDFIAMTQAPEGSTEPSQGSATLPPFVCGYKVSRLLGRGAFGEVRVGEHQITNEMVALKFLRKSEIISIGAAERTATEIQCLMTLKHHNIIILQQHVETPNHVVLVFELMEGGDLLKFLCRRGKTAEEIALPEDEARGVFHQIASGISFAHSQHICHRDLKLENILLKSNSLSHVKIADFGLSDFYRPGATMKSNCGTLSFLAPEVFRGTSNAGPPLDVWSLGVILFAMVCGRLPFEGTELNNNKRPRESIIRARIMKCQYKVEEEVGPEVRDLIRRMLKLDADERASVPELFNHCWMRQGFHAGSIPDSTASNSSSSSSAANAASLAQSTNATNVKDNNSIFSSNATSTSTTAGTRPRAGTATEESAFNQIALSALNLGSPVARANSPTGVPGESSSSPAPVLTSPRARSRQNSRTLSERTLEDLMGGSSDSINIGDSNDALNLLIPLPDSEGASTPDPSSLGSSSSSTGAVGFSSPTFKLIPLRRISVASANIDNLGDSDSSLNSPDKEVGSFFNSPRRLPSGSFSSPTAEVARPSTVSGGSSRHANKSNAVTPVGRGQSKSVSMSVAGGSGVGAIAGAGGNSNRITSSSIDFSSDNSPAASNSRRPRKPSNSQDIGNLNEEAPSGGRGVGNTLDGELDSLSVSMSRRNEGPPAPGLRGIGRSSSYKTRSGA